MNNYQLLPPDEQPQLLLVLPQLVLLLVEDPLDLLQVLQVPVPQTVTKIPQMATLATPVVPHLIQTMTMTMTSKIYEII